jgi:hypothetical protein
MSVAKAVAKTIVRRNRRNPSLCDRFHQNRRYHDEVVEIHYFSALLTVSLEIGHRATSD